MTHDRRLPVLLGFLGGIAFYGGALVLSSWSIGQLDDTAEWRRHTHEVILEVRGLWGQLLAAETGSRGFRLTGDVSLLASYEAAERGLPERLGALRRLTGDNPRQQARLARLEPLVRRKSTLLEEQNELRRQGRLDPTTSAATTLEGERIAHEIRALIAQLEGEELTLLTARSARLRETLDRAKGLMNTAGVLGIGLLVLVFLGLDREIRRRRASERELGAARDLLREANADLDRRVVERTAELRRSEERYRGVLDSMREGFQIIGSDWRYVYLNDVAADHDQRRKEDLLGRTVMECYPGIEATEVFGRLRRCMETRKSQSMENEFTYPDGSKRWFALSIEPAPEGIFVVSLDITESRRAEEMFRQSQKLEAIGRLAGGVAHDFNNLLGVITGYGELARKQIPDAHPARPRLEEMLKAAERAAGLTQQLLAFSRRQVMQPRLLDLSAVVSDLARMLHRVVGEDVEIEVRAAEMLGTVRSDPTQMQQLIMNLVVNARDAMPKGGHLTIETANTDFDEDYAASHPPAQRGRFVMLAISDTGIGMDPKTQQRIFEPFFTTKPEGEGTGLGLATVYGIVKQSGGYIWLYSEPGQGTTFKVYLPRVDEATRVEAAPAATAPAPRGHETVLVVEDSGALREVIREVLEQQGYTVLLASHGEEGLALLREREGAIHLLLTDVVMPKLGGGELAEQLKALRPEIPVLYMSGYTNGAISRQGVLVEGVALLEKPFTGDRLARAVREALDRPAAGRASS